MATPHLAAAAAYVKLKHPDYNQREVYSVFRDYAVDLGEPGKQIVSHKKYMHALLQSEDSDAFIKNLYSFKLLE